MAAEMFDARALLEYADIPLPVRRDDWPRYVNQLRSDAVAAAEYILELEARLAGRVAA